MNFLDAAKTGQLKPVSFVKPIGEENEHPGYACEPTGSTHLVQLLKAVESGKQAKDTMVIVTYDEFGGQWDHVSPPRRVTSGAPVPASPPWSSRRSCRHPFAIDSTSHDTTSILATIEKKFHLAPLTRRDAKVTDLSTAFAAPAGPVAGGQGGGGGTGPGGGEAAGGASAPGLPITGTNVTVLVVGGLALVLAGVAAVAVARRRRTG